MDNDTDLNEMVKLLDTRSLQRLVVYLLTENKRLGEGLDTIKTQVYELEARIKAEYSYKQSGCKVIHHQFIK